MYYFCPNKCGNTTHIEGQECPVCKEDKSKAIAANRLAISIVEEKNPELAARRKRRSELRKYGI